MATIDYSVKNARIVKALQEKKPYWYLNDSQYEGSSLVQIAGTTDRIPLKYLLRELGVKDWGTADLGRLWRLVGYGPELEIGRDATFESAPGTLLRDMVLSLLESLKDSESGEHAWGMDFGRNDFVWIGVGNDEYSINNYRHTRRYVVWAVGIHAFTTSKSYHVDPEETFYQVGIKDLSAVLAHAAEIAQKILDGEKTVVCPTCGKPYTHKD